MAQKVPMAWLLTSCLLASLISLLLECFPPDHKGRLSVPPLSPTCLRALAHAGRPLLTWSTRSTKSDRHEISKHTNRPHYNFKRHQEGRGALLQNKMARMSSFEIGEVRKGSLRWSMELQMKETSNDKRKEKSFRQGEQHV